MTRGTAQRPRTGPRSASAPAAKKPSRITLEGIHRGKKKVPDRVLIYGVGGVGKSSWAADAPAPIFIAAEDGVNHLDVAQFDDPRPETYDEILEAVDVLTKEDHDFKTLAIDSIDWVEHLVRDKVISENRHEKTGQPWTTQDYDAYGRGVKLAVDEFRKLIDALERLQRVKGMGVILVAHAIVANFKNPTGEDFMTYKPALTGDLLPNLFGDWVDAVLFATYDVDVQKSKGFARNKAWSDGSRVVYTTHNACWVAKNRYGLPEAIDLDYETYAGFRDSDRSASVDGMLKQVRELRDRLELDDEKTKKMDAWIKQAGEKPSRLQKVIDGLKAKLAEQEDE